MNRTPQDFVALEVHLHPYYRFTPQADRYDVAVIKLERRVAFEPHISPICLPEKLEAVPDGTVAMVAGWGATDPASKERPVTLQAADVNVVNSTLCESWHRKNELKVFIEMISGFRKMSPIFTFHFLISQEMLSSALLSQGWVN